MLLQTYAAPKSKGRDLWAKLGQQQQQQQPNPNLFNLLLLSHPPGRHFSVRHFEPWCWVWQCLWFQAEGMGKTAVQSDVRAVPTGHTAWAGAEVAGAVSLGGDPRLGPSPSLSPSLPPSPSLSSSPSLSLPSPMKAGDAPAPAAGIGGRRRAAQQPGHRACRAPPRSAAPHPQRATPAGGSPSPGTVGGRSAPSRGARAARRHSRVSTGTPAGSRSTCQRRPLHVLEWRGRAGGRGSKARAGACVQSAHSVSTAGLSPSGWWRWRLGGWRLRGP